MRRVRRTKPATQAESAFQPLRPDRRQVLGLGALLLASASYVRAGAPQCAAPRFLSAASDADDCHWILGFSVADGLVHTEFKRELPERAHHVEVNQRRGFFVVVARRPGTWLQLGSLVDGSLTQAIQVPADRHLFGHGVFSADGGTFYTTESDFDDIRGDSGRIVAWRVEGDGAAARLVRGAELPSYGVGPHELLLHPDGETLIIANGGIRTHPSHDRDNLNIDTMLPSLAYIDRHSGALLEQHFLPAQFHQAGIRHMDVNAAGVVALGMQFEGEPFLAVPLVATHRRGESLRLLDAPPELQPQMKQYVGSVRFDMDGRYFATSCPKGNLLTFWDADNGALLHSTRARDGCGVCASAGGFVFSTGTGRLAHIDLATSTVSDLTSGADIEHLFWDNHLSAGRV